MSSNAIGSSTTFKEAGLCRLRRGCLAVLVLLVVEYGLGMYVNLYVTVPRADRDGSLGSAISAGPPVLSVHIVVGLVLGLAAVAVLAQAIAARRWAVSAISVIGLAALAFASAAGAGFTSSGDAAESMAMSVMTGVALVCYAVSLYMLRSARR